MYKRRSKWLPGNTCTSEGKFPISTFQNKIFGRFKIFSSKDIYIANGHNFYRPSNKYGWLTHFLSCIRMFMSEGELPPGRFVSKTPGKQEKHMV